MNDKVLQIPIFIEQLPNFVEDDGIPFILISHFHITHLSLHRLHLRLQFIKIHFLFLDWIAADPILASLYSCRNV